MGRHGKRRWWRQSSQTSWWSLLSLYFLRQMSRKPWQKWQLFSVDAQALACQIARHRPTAQAIRNSTQCSNQEAWQKTVQRSKEVRASARLMLDSLRPVVMRYLVWSCSTAGVEQRFSVGDKLGVDRTPASQIAESLTLRVVFDKVSADERKEVVRRA